LEEDAMPNEISDAALTGELSGLIDSLRSPGYRHVASGIDQALDGFIDGFSDLLAKHLLYEEEVLFPGLREAAPDQAQDLLGLLVEHKDLRGRALDLARHVKSGNRARACRVGREFLATLFDHIHREEEVTRRISSGLTDRAALRLKSRLEREEKAPGPDIL
jgi:hemerythrin-like domain-containing protein